MLKTAARFAVLLALIAVGCAHKQQETKTGTETGAQTPASQEQSMGSMSPHCPMAVPGTRVDASETDLGAALNFKTEQAGVEDLRMRVQSMADIHNAHRGLAQGGSGMGMGMGSPALQASEASVQNTEDGARLVFTAQNQSDVQAVREGVRSNAQQMQQSGSCGMMGDAPVPSDQPPMEHPSVPPPGSGTGNW